MRRRPVRRKRTRIGIGGLLTAAVLVGSTAGTQAGAVTVAKGDLDFILQQIKISENHAGGGALLGNGPNQVPAAQLPYGVRTIDGSENNLIAGREKWGAADELFPRLLPKNYRDTEPAPPAPAPQTALTNYSQGGDGSLVYDSQPRQISNLVADQSTANPAANAAAVPGGELPEGDINVIPNVAPAGGLAAPFNSWMTLFGQFFDHGLDLVPKGGNGSVIIPLKPDDPLIAGPDGVLGNGDDLPANRRFMTLTRATIDANGESINLTTPFIDQQQTYGSHPSVHFFLREYEATPSGPVPTGRMLEGADGGLTTWADVKTQAQDILGIILSDTDALNVPLVMVDQYGDFLPGGQRGMPQIVIGGSPVETNTGAGAVPTGSADRSGHPFLADIAHFAVPSGTPDANATADPNTPPAAGTYDDELLDEHFIAGDGRVNENIGLTAVHHVFHAEHNRMVGEIQTRVIQYARAGNDLAFLNEWLATPAGALPGDASPATIAALDWNGKRVFHAARLVTEMEYQHLVFEEFARTIEPTVAPFAAYSEDIDPTIVAEFAHVVYRFGHSMLRENVEVTAANGADRDLGLIQAFLNPLEYDETNTLTAEQAAGAIARGMTRQVGNEIDEFTTDALRNNLLGLPLDLATLNLTRARETGVPSLNAARRSFFQSTGDPALAPHASWADFSVALRHPESLINFVAAYGRHPDILGAGTSAQKRAAAANIVLADDLDPGTTRPADAVDFLNSTGTWAPGANGLATTGLEDVDFWIGGLAEAAPAAGGMLSPTFAFVFRQTLENLQSGDRFYYLLRLEGLSLLPEVEANSFGEMVQRNTDARTIPFVAFMTPDFVFDLQNLGNANLSDPAALIPQQPGGQFRFVPNPTPPAPLGPVVGDEHIVMSGTEGADNMRSGLGDDTIWGFGGDDTLDGDQGADALIGGGGNDVIVDSGDAVTADTIKGGPGDDALNGGQGPDAILAGEGRDVIIGTAGPKEVFAGSGNDMFLGGTGDDTAMGNEGDDWMEGGDGADALIGGHDDPLQADTTTGDDVLIGGIGDDANSAEGGDDIMVNTGGVDEHLGGFGFDWVTHVGDAQPAVSDLNNTPFVPPVPGNPLDALVDTFHLTEALSGWNQDDTLRGDNRGNGDPAVDALQGPFAGHELLRPAVIQGLQDLLGGGVTEYSGGNILLGGAGSDLIEGRGGDDLIDGDRWLDVYLEIPGAGGPPERVNSIAEIQARIFNRTLLPSQVTLVREIRTAAPGASIDTAQFSGPRADYDVDISTPGQVTVTHARGAQTDGSDTLKNVEQLQFSDETLAIAAIPANQPATGAPAISDTTPDEGQPLTASQGDINDVDGLNPAGITYEWQADFGGAQGWTQVHVGPAFTPDDAVVGLPLRVIASFSDNAAGPENRTSAPTASVVNVNDAPTGAPIISNNSPLRGAQITVSTASIADADGLTGATFAIQWQQRTGNTWSDIGGANDAAFTPGSDQVGKQLRVMVTYDDDRGASEALFSDPTSAVPNSAPTGAPVISDDTPTRGEDLTVATDTINDPDGLPGTLGIQWQQGGPGAWSDIGGANGALFTPGSGQVGKQLRVVVSYTDGAGASEQVVSIATSAVADVPAPPATSAQQPSAPPAGAPARAAGASCRMPVPSASGNASAVRLAAGQLLINQRISQAAVRRVNALAAKMDGKPAPKTNPNANSGAGRVTLSTNQLLINQRISQAAVRRINALIAQFEGRPAPRATNNPPGRVTLSAKQLLINQRISQAAVRRVNALEQCVNEQG